MFGYKRIVIAEHERGLYFKDKRLVKVLMPGVHRVLDLFKRIQVQVHDLTKPVLDHPQGEVFVKTSPGIVAEHLEQVVVGDQQVVLVSYNGVFAELLPPSTRRVYWKGPVKVERQVIDIQDEFTLSREQARVLARPALPRALANYVHTIEIADYCVGLLIVDGELARTLPPGFHAFWRLNRSVMLEQIDTRVQPMEVNGQDILTLDKVTLRINLTAQYRISDPMKARADLKNPADWLYRELQFALRQVIGARTLDALLGNKEGLDQPIFAAVADRAAGYGLTVTSVGIKDVILPGDMKEILNQVMEAEKRAQANLIKRREETAATRSLLNTARLMDENPTLLRLKELEVLETITGKVEHLTVFGGLDGVLKDTVRINVKG